MTFTYTCTCGKKVSNSDTPPVRDAKQHPLCPTCAATLDPSFVKFLRPMKHLGWRNGQHVTTST